ncbi:MAG: glycosyltransferase family 2 protein [Kiritimatiellia bacterium]
MKFSIITPSFNSGRYLPLAAASVADQAGVPVEHIVADGGSTDGTRAWLESQAGLRWISERDAGMYDALNKGMALARGELFGYLNCDEQYFPGTLAAVAAAFEANPDVDLLYGDMLLVGPDGRLLAFRKSYPLRWPYVAAAHLYVPSCALFWRRRVFDGGIAFDMRWRIQGDADFVVRMLRAGYRGLHLTRYLAAFTLGDTNLGNTPSARAEMLAARAEAPWWIRHFRIGWDGARRIEKMLSGAHRQRFPIDYEIFTPASLPNRIRLTAAQGTSRWPC